LSYNRFLERRREKKMINKEAPEKLIKALSYYTNHSINKNIEKIIVAGGFIRSYYAGENIADLDLYFREKGHLQETLLELTDNGWIETFKTDRAISLRKDEKIIQLISYAYGEPDEIINIFDFTICSAAMTITRHKIQDDTSDEPSIELKGRLVLHDDYFEHLAGRILVFTSTPLPLSSLKRVIKFLKRGYSICDENIIKIAEAIFRQVNFDDEGNLTEHLAGIDPNSRGIRVID
jgi:hypothetical protein